MTRPPSSTLRLGLPLLLTLSLACSGSSTPSSTPQAKTTAASPEPQACPTFDIERAGQVQDPAMNEISGLAAATVLPGGLWAHNDSGGQPRLFLAGRDGEVHGHVRLRGAEAYDWEDLAAAPGRDGEPRVLVVGDVGDNFRKRDEVQLYRLAEPALTDLGGEVEATRFDVRFPDGAHDVEAIFVDPRDGVVYLATKALFGSSSVYAVQLPTRPEGTLTATPVAELPRALLTGADMSGDGRRIILRDYRAAYLYEGDGQESVAAMLQRAACRVALPREPQGESIAFADPRTLLLLSEQDAQPVYVLSETGPVP